MDDVLKSGHCESPLGYDNVYWFDERVIKLENKLAFSFKNINKDIIMSEKDEEDYRTNNICRFCWTINDSDKVWDLCHLTRNWSRPAHQSCNFIVTRKRSIFIPFVFHMFSNYDCHLFF